MKSNEKKRLKAEFGPESRFEVRPAAPVPFRAQQEDAFERLKARLLAERLEEAWEPELTSFLRRAANDAAALAWVTAYPLLVFPTLFAEFADSAVLRAERQEEVRQRSRELLAV